MRQQLLEDWTPAFRLLVGQNKPMENFWTCMFADYWATFSWRRPFDEDPPLGRDPEEDEDLNLEDSRARARTVAQTNRRIKSFFYYHYHKANGEA
ncbi:hypothetical protein B0H16DRAFT_1709756 [Mycena metata]|uniref:Uncharacterized protein n=1 Tax=Mycena metata TaxID=1033252 RepID=A0AAD7HAV4_9AGAR|nr:hypothetical protein B0H16DRAFT_1751375 [Mycena metata]KAJ7715642.1 hypothetical protein B0H16DRAFT_1741805 [Mycena metata]KAJ7782925.1 hypothetical protein B0H16DRAFT_1709756 [Mycena metata]